MFVNRMFLLPDVVILLKFSLPFLMWTNQEELDDLLGLDGEEDFAIYLAPVEKVKKSGN